MTRKEELAKAIKLLGEEGDALFARALKAKDVDVLRFGGQYQKWYSKALRLVEVLAPDRLKEFVSHYERDPKRKSIDALTYSIQDFVLGIGPTNNDYDTNQIAAIRLINQKQILDSLEERLDSIYANIEAVIAAEVYDRELAGARTLLKVSPRAAGVVAGVVLEDHLLKVAAAHKISLRRKGSTLAKLNDALRDADVYGVPIWRKVQYLADIRNLCAHKKGEEPSGEQVADLITGVDEIIKTVQ